MSNWSRKVFRLRRIPGHVSAPQQAAQLLGVALGVNPDHVLVHSLATTSDRWETPPSKVATLQFDGDAVLSYLGDDPARQEWEISLPVEGGDKLVLDNHFGGLTALNHVETSSHRADCIAISGLASHAFGSWQPHGGDKSYMWIRDEISKSLPGVRAIIYGYDSKIIDSDSFQSISDIALGLIHQLKAGGWNLPSAKPIVFLAHSLGGIVLKEALVQVADRDAAFSSIVENVRGAIMFGVPSLGMLQSHLMALAEGQPNENLIQDLSRENGSTYLRQLNKSFEGISFTRNTRVFWAYETKESRTVIRRSDGTWERNGPLAVLVNPDSATCHHNRSRKNRVYTIPINEDHTNMVKFSRGEPNLGVILTVLTDLCFTRDEHHHTHTHLPFGDAKMEGMSRQNPYLVSPSSPKDAKDIQSHEAIEELGQLLQSIERSIQSLTWSVELQAELYSPELDFRIDSIQDPFQNTFKWIFDMPEFSDWLIHGTGLFWIHGKPGSGKSTLMKYITRSRQTQELLHDWTTGALEVQASFFFHYRGTALQKSFEGIMRSLILQILSAHSESFLTQHRPIWESYAKHQAVEKLLVAEKANAELTVIAIKGSIEEVQQRQAGLGTTDRKVDHEMLGEYQTRQRLILSELRDLEEKIRIVQRDMLQAANVYWPYRILPEAKFLTNLVKNSQEDDSALIFKLEKLLRALLDQSIKSMDLVLFFDALDEFDGHLDRISKFITSLSNVSSASTTRVKVCLSSRPWRALHSHFDSCPNFGLQDFTKADIATYAAGSLAESRISNPSFIDLIPVIISRANGVFLWVRLAVRELLLSIASNSIPASRRHLEKRLEMLPDDLHDFYRLIIERISLLNRRKTYVLLELLLRQQDPQPTAEDIRRAVLTSDCATWDKAQEELTEDYELISHDRRSVKDIVRDDILTWGGGLVEIKRNHPQFMHQTVLELVQDLTFKKSVLGELAVVLKENGHSFHLKYWISAWSYGYRGTNEGLEGKRIAYHAEHSELTTGNSHFEFLSSVPSQFLKVLPGFHPTLKVSDHSLLAFISSNGLTLCLRDWIERHGDELKLLEPETIYFPLLSTLVFSPGSGEFHERHLITARLLLENGFNMKQDDLFLATLFRTLWTADRTGSDNMDFTEPVARQLAVLALEHGHDPNPILMLATRTGHELQCTPLHIARPRLAEDLIRFGANVNTRDSTGRTPLDWVLRFPSDVLAHVNGLEWGCARRYEACKILTSAGGVAALQPERAWAEALADFAKGGHDTQVLRTNFQCSRRGGTWGGSLSQLFSFGRR
ncbi:unnamed protein product [Clonostachys solani]|uniref:Nephrocystin 3-like N-terminal domain-containing protein n=1 Tax=Clonostachys solani TaxID=160281 RepID=A0A9N9Z255_9HYPO|nr:unnamed protein product [Clonostachys solani]